MGYSAPYVDGKLVQNSASSNSLSSQKKSGSSLDKDAFLQLLVAQMKYQDPMEPTSNTEYVAQLATFSELEEMQNMRNSMDMQRAGQLVGKDVIINSTDDAGDFTQFRGKVDYVQMEGGKVFVSVGGSLYSIDDVYNVVDEKYLVAFEKVSKLGDVLDKLPTPPNCKDDNQKDMEELMKLYNDLNDYEKTFLGQDVKELIKKYEEKLEEIKKLNGSGKPEEPTDPEEPKDPEPTE